MNAQRQLNREIVISTALLVADRDGLDAVTIRGLAQQRGVTPMALYRHFRDKEEIFDALAEHLLAGVRLPEVDDRPWHEQLADLLAAYVGALRPHPNLAELVLTRMFISDWGLAIAERILLLLEEAGFPMEQAANIGIQTVCSLVSMVITQPGHGGSADPEERDAEIRAKRAYLMSLPPQRYPHLVAAADPLALCVSEDAYYARGVALVVSGLRTVEREAAAAPAGQGTAAAATRRTR
jgi:AcrR family transcriptional regulator